MNNFIYFDLNGDPLYTASYSNDDDIPSVSGDVVAQRIELDTSPDELLRDYWLDGDSISYRGCKPESFYVWDKENKAWIDPRTPETQWIVVRAERDKRLSATDWTQLPDVPLETQLLYRDYRQALRDITLQPDPFNILWPNLTIG